MCLTKLQAQIVRCCLLLICSLLCASSAFALDPNKSFSQYVIDTWQMEQGLPDNFVNDIIQDRNGYIWMGTRGGIVRFDGVRFTVFDKNNYAEIRVNDIYKAVQDQSGTLWFGTLDSGLIKFNNGRLQLFTTADGLASNKINALYVDTSGNLWIGTDGAGLNCYRDGKFITYNTSNGLTSNTVSSIIQGYDGTIWVATMGGGVNYLRDGRWHAYTTKDGLSSNMIKAIYEDHNKTIWIGTFSDGINYISQDKINVFKPQNSLTKFEVNTITEDRSGTIWIGTVGNGLGRLRDNNLTFYTNVDGLANSVVNDVYEDHEGSLWIALEGGGINRLRDGKFIAYTTKQGLANDTINSIVEDQSNNLWIATAGGGVARLDDKGITNFTIKDGLPSDSINAINKDKNGVVWFGTTSGLAKYENDQFIKVPVDKTLSATSISSIAFASNQDLWVGTFGAGVYLLSGNNKTIFNKNNGFITNVIFSLFEAQDHSFWIGTREGLAHYIDGQFSYFTTKDGLVSNKIYTIFQDKDGAFWFGTATGLNRFYQGKFVTYTSKEGLFDDTIYGIINDDNDNLWFSSRKGVFRVARKELNSFANGQIASINCIGYGKADGMKSEACSGYFYPSVCRSHDGRLWFPTTKGVAVIDPNNIRTNNLPPPVFIESITNPQSATEKSITNLFETEEQSLTFAPGTTDFEFRFTSLSLLAPERVKFKYRLTNKDNDWVDVGTRRTAFFTNLAPGYYSFTVIACNNDGVWNNTGATINFYIKPYFYQTIPFYILASLFVIGLSISIPLLRVRQLQIREKKLIQLADKRARQMVEAKRKLEEANQALELVFGAVIDGKYRIDALIKRDEGVSGKGRIFRVTHTHLNQSFFLKLLDYDATDDEIIVPLKKAVEALARVRHPNVAGIIDFNIVPNRPPYIVMEYFEGQNLAVLLSQKGKLAQSQAVIIARQVAAGLHAAHLQNIIHGHLQPGNIIIQIFEEDIITHITGFPLGMPAKKIDANISSSSSLSNDERIVQQSDSNNSRYIMPEKQRGLVTDVRSDVYSLCLIAYEMVCGFEENYDLNDKESLRSHANDVSIEFLDVVMKGLSQSPEDRQQTALELKHEFEQLEQLQLYQTNFDQQLETAIDDSENPTLMITNDKADKSDKKPVSLTVKATIKSQLNKINFVKECPKCKYCYDETEKFCPEDKVKLLNMEGIPRLINGRYRLEKLLGRGGMGAVYRATDQTLKRDVACKVVRATALKSPHILERFRREAQTLGKLNHPNIVSIFDYGSLPDGTAFLIMELLTGYSLQSEIDRKERFTISEAVKIIHSIAKAIAYAHDHGIIHRDLKPDNVILLKHQSSQSDPYHIKLIDFGLVKQVEEVSVPGEHLLTNAGQLIGTPLYMPPEQARGIALDIRADIYSLGIIFYELLSGRVPFRGETVGDTIYKHFTEPPPPFKTWNLDIDEEIEDLIRQMLAKEPEDRPANATILLQKLNNIVETFSRYE